MFLPLKPSNSPQALSSTMILNMPYVEYKGTVPQKDMELEANALISRGGKGSTPRIVKLGESPGCRCGGTHVSDISEIKSVTVSQIRTKKGSTKVFYNVGS
ncbi:uncharacterized protein Pyn_26442 [Prunus yedoensis var. nudiflora]|uniref:Uncharacterized protein n=1 Tax=Prunus yedoensis var. nudiflora TaxID=2094558 RepID=A0A314ZEL4_PRUYE|nr:uncharacterized protein Pyn_26442 [Prunus yedoensis var. nudiflora]